MDYFLEHLITWLMWIDLYIISVAMGFMTTAIGKYAKEMSAGRNTPLTHCYRLKRAEVMTVLQKKDGSMLAPTIIYGFIGIPLFLLVLPELGKAFITQARNKKKGTTHVKY